MGSEIDPDSKVYNISKGSTHKQVSAGEWTKDVLKGRDSARSGDEIAVGHFTDPLIGRRPATIPYDSLLRGLINIGESGVGKSTLTDNILIQMAEDGYGFCHIDMRGQVNDLIQQLPDDRADDIEIIGSYKNKDRKGFDILETPPDDEYIDQASASFADFVGADLTGISKAIVGGIGKLAFENDMNIEDVLGMLYEEDSNDNVDVDESYYGPLMNSIRSLEAEDMEMEPVIRRIKRIAETPMLNRIITDEDGLSLYNAISEGKIIIVSPESVADIDTKTEIAHAVLRKMINVFKHTQSSRENFFISVDEADHLQISDHNLDWYFTRSRGYDVGVILTIQYLDQIEDRRMVLNNTENLVTFRHSEVETANRLTSLLDIEGRDEIMDLDRYTIFTRLNGKYGLFNRQISTFPQLKCQIDS